MIKRITLFSFLALLFVAAAAFAAEYTPGRVLELKSDGERAVLKCEGADVYISGLAGGILSVEVVGGKIQHDFPSFLTVVDELSPAPVEIDPEEKVIVSGGLKARISTASFGLDVLKDEKLLLRRLPGGVKWKDDGGYSLAFERMDADHFLGLGEPLPDVIGIPMKLDYRGEKRAIWNNHRPPSDLGIPMFFNPTGYGLYVDNPWAAEFDFKGSTFTYTAAGGPIRFYVFDAPDAFALLDAYTRLTGRPPIPPRWALGYIQSRANYMNHEDFRWLMKNFRERQIPCDVLIFDLEWFDRRLMGNLWWSPEHFPDAENFQELVEANGFKSIAITEPYVFRESYNYEKLRGTGVYASGPDGPDYFFPFWGTKASLMDFTSPATQKWYGEQIIRIKNSGIDAWWTDLDEPERDEGAAYHIGPNEAGHNLQAFLMNRAIADVYRDSFPDERLLIMSRSGFSGIQRWGSSVWSGDVQSTWNHLRDQIPTALSSSLSGLGYWNSDTGGFHGEPSPELYTRWVQFSAFTPMLRAHGGRTKREPWMFGDEAERVCKKYIELRMRLIPYLYGLFREMHLTGAPPMRPTFMHWPEAGINLDTQFFLGRDLLVVPVTEEGAGKKRVVLPPGGWTYFWDERAVDGPKTMGVPVDLDTTPLFVRAGAIIPMYPVMRHTREKAPDPLTIHYYPGPERSVYELYEDDGETRGYERGEFAITKIEASRENGMDRVAISKPEGSYDGMLKERSYEIVIHHAPGAGSVSWNLESDPQPKFDDSSKILIIMTPPVSTTGRVEVEVSY
ncbi:MAG: TIM-barrel domain-containing protein [bacterium]